MLTLLAISSITCWGLIEPAAGNQGLYHNHSYIQFCKITSIVWYIHITQVLRPISNFYLDIMFIIRRQQRLLIIHHGSVTCRQDNRRVHSSMYSGGLRFVSIYRPCLVDTDYNRITVCCCIRSLCSDRYYPGGTRCPRGDFRTHVNKSDFSVLYVYILP